MSFFESVKNVLSDSLSSTTTYQATTNRLSTRDTYEKNRDPQTVNGAISKYFEPAAGKLRIRDVAREMFGFGKGIENAKMYTVPKGVVNFGVDMLQEIARSGGSVGITGVNTLKRGTSAVTGKQPRLIDEIAIDENTPAWEKNFQRIIFGEDPLESIGTRIDRAPTRATETARAFGFDDQKIVTDKSAMFLVPAMIALDFTGAGGKADDVFKGIAKADKASDVFKLLKGNFSNLPKGQELELSRRLAKVTDPRKVQITIDNFMRAAEVRKLERTVQPVVTKTVNKGFGTAMDIQKRTAKAVDTGTTKSRKFAETITQSDLLDPQVTQRMAQNYNPMNNKSLAEEAAKFINESQDDAIVFVKDNLNDYSDFNNTVAQQLIRRLNNAGRYDEALELADVVTEKAVKAGRAVQSFALWNRMSPEGLVLKANKIAKEVAKKGGKHRLTDDKLKKIVDLANKVENMEDGVQKAEDTAKILSELNSIAPPSIGRQISTLQTMAQLLNPKTFMRNVIGNGGFSVIENIKDVPAAAFDSAVSVFTGKRTKSIPSLGAQIRGIGKGSKEGWRDALLGIDTSGVPNRFELPTTPVFKDKKVLDGAEKLLNISLRVPDRAMYKAAYDGSIYQSMKAHYNTTGKLLKEPTDEMLELAHYEGLYRTFQDENAMTFMFTNLKRALNAGKDFGLGDIVLKYPKTPANLLNRGLAYSPAGFLNATFEMARPLFGKPFNQKNFVEAMSRASTGSAGLVGTGAIMHQLGILRGARNEDRDIANVEQEVGLNGYQVNVSALKRFVASGFDAGTTELQAGDQMYNVDWFQPVIFPVVFGANLNAGLTGQDAATQSFLASFGAAIDSVGEQSLVENFTEAFRQESISGVVIQALRQVPASFIPTLVNQMKQVMDNSRRQIYSPDDVQYAKNLAMNRVPGLANNIQPRISAFGNEMETYQNGSNNLFNVFFNPGFATTYQPTPEAQLVLDLYNQTGETAQAPRLKSFNQKVNGENVTLGPRQMRALQQTVGTMTRLEFHALAMDAEFLALDPQQQVNYMSKQMTAIGTAAKHWVLGDNKEAHTKNGYDNLEKMYLQKLYSGVYGDPTGLRVDGSESGNTLNNDQNEEEQSN